MTVYSAAYGDDALGDAGTILGYISTFDGVRVDPVGFALTLLNSGFDEITNPRLRLERVWRKHLAKHGEAATRSTPVVRHG